MAKHVIYGGFGLLAAIVIAAAIYFDKPALDEGLAALGPESADAEDQTQTAALGNAAVSSDLYDVIKVIDGDTLTVKIAGESETIRLIGIDTPETGANGECFAAEATAALKKLAGARVRLEKDSSQGERDKYDRILAYVFSEEGVHTGEQLIEEGFAKEYTYSKAYKYQAAYKAAQKSAQDSKKGLWAPSACAKSSAPKKSVVEEPVPVPVQAKKAAEEPVSKVEEKVEEKPTPVKKQETPPESQEASDPVDTSSYTCSTNKYNCTDFETHAEAQAVFEQCGGSSNDIHKLDSNKDGEACESLP
ncbi:MAG: thermonuclease family protein [Candidatus Pacebacteria bacterium]|nr:thermonuclease family protein [Candidatus Paceibacterota bacterium]